MTKEEAWALERTELEALEGGDLVEELIRRYRPLVYATARRLCPGLCRDEDLLQCGLIGLWRAAEQWDRERPRRAREKLRRGARRLLDEMPKL